MTQAKWSRAMVFSLFAALLCGAVIYSRAVRRVALGAQFQYVPREAELIIATGDIESLWDDVELLFGHVLEPGGLLESLGKDLRKQTPPITGPADLRHLGLDIGRGFLISIYRPTTDRDFVTVVPIVDADLLLKSLKEKKTPSKTLMTDPGSGKTCAVYEIDKNFFVAFPEPGLAVLASSKDLMSRSVTHRAENLAHASNNDALYHAVRHVARGPLLVGPKIFAYWQSRTAPFDARSAVIRLSRSEINIDGEIELRGGTLRVVDDLRRRGNNDSKWMDRLPDKTVGVAVLQDEQLSRYGDFVAEEFLSESKTVSETMQRWAPGLNLPHIQRVAVAVTDYQDGLPDFLVGIWGDRNELETMRKQLQQTYRKSRDLMLLTGALAKYRQSGGPPPSLADLQRLHLLQPEDYSLFHRYPIQQGRAGDPEFAPQDFANAIYERTIQGHVIRFMAPPLGQNDVAYRPNLATVDAATLHNDRYRMATVFEAGALWIATDVHDLETFLKPRAERHAAGGPALAASPSGAKLHIALDVDRLMSLGLLSPGSELEKLVRGNLIALQDFSLLRIDAVPSITQDRLRFSATLRRGAGR